MSNLLVYKGYAARVEFDADDGVLHGVVDGMRDVVHFEGDSAAAVKRAFQESVDDYLEFCRHQNKSPEKSKSGTFNVRVDPATHRRIELAAQKAGMSMNEWVARHLNDDATREVEPLEG